MHFIKSARFASGVEIGDRRLMHRLIYTNLDNNSNSNSNNNSNNNNNNNTATTTTCSITS
eukprot:2182701-Amphidinium_carterae.1